MLRQLRSEIKEAETTQDPLPEAWPELPCRAPPFGASLGFPKIGASCLGVLAIRIMVY